MHFSVLLSRHRTVLGVVVAAAAAVAVVAAGLAYATMGTAVTLSVDGKATPITTHGETVEEVLAGEGIEVDERDVVAPDLDEVVEDGTLIAVKFARPLDVVVDGDKTRYWVTATEVSTALGQIGMRVEGAELSVSRGTPISRSGLSLRVVTPKRATYVIGGEKPVKRTLNAVTVRQALDELGVTVDKDDKVAPRLSSKLSDGDRVVVTKVRTVTRTVQESLAYGTVTRSDSGMYDDESTTVREGRSGSRDAVYRVRLENGESVARELVRVENLVKPVDKIVKVGTKDRPAPAANFAGGNTVWDSLASCESGGNWAINTGNGYYGGLQFNLATWQAYGGTGYPHQHSRETQIAIATKLRDARGGYGAWPSCSAKLGLPR